MAAPTEHILVVDDDAGVGKVLAALLQQEGWRSAWVASGDAALLELERRPYSAILSDVRMPGLDGMQLLAQVAARWPEVPVVLLTAHGTVPLAVEAMKAGAADFLLKPFDRAEVLFTVRKVLAGAREESKAARPEAAGDDLFIGGSAQLAEVLQRIDKAAQGMATVLVRGETGTGKELVARALHARGPRRGGPLVKLNCAALPDALLESELFGYEKGAFTGAASRKPGRVELAHGGTLFLDEIGDVTPAVQVKLLRLLQEREFERLGGTETVRVDVRFVAATHRDLEDLVARGTFREDLFYRLNVIPIWLPPLRERPGDVAPLVQHLCKQLGPLNGKPGARVDDAGLALLAAQPWPGNVRQLENFLERLLLLGDGPVIGAADIAAELGRQPLLARQARMGSEAQTAPAAGETLDLHRREAEKTALRGALVQAKDNRTVAARLLGVSRRTLYNKLEEHGLA